MSLANYSDVIARVKDWSGRSDSSAIADVGIALTESKVNRYLRVKSMLSKNASFTINAEYVAVPTDFGGVKSFYLNTTDTSVLDWMPDELITNTWQGQTGQPQVYGVQGANFRFGPVPDTSYTATLVYYQKVPALTGSATTNWLITNHPDVYLYGVMAEASAAFKDASSAQAYWQLMYQALDQLKLASNRDTYSGDGAVFARPG